MDLPVIMTATGPQPRTPAVLRAQLVASVAAVNPGYTDNLPGTLIEDIASTDVGALLMCDADLVDLINSITPYGANPYLLAILGQMLGIQIGLPTNTSVFVVISGPPNYVIAQGFTVSDGTYQYTLPDGGVIGSGGASMPLFAVANVSGSWVVPAGSVVDIVTSLPTSISLTVTNPLAGTSGVATGESETSYRSRVLQANLAASQGMARYLKTFLQNIPGVQPRLVSVLQLAGQGWEVICGGGDSAQVAYAIYTALFDINQLQGSQLLISGITNAANGVVTTTLNHGFTTGQVINITGVVGMTGINNVAFTITVLTEKTFELNLNTTSSGSYISGGVITPNFRNIVVSLTDYPDVYAIPYVNPPLQTVTATITWNTIATSFVNSAAVAQLGSVAVIAYINSIVVGQPINILQLEEAFQVAIAAILPPYLLTRIETAVSINGISTAPLSGTKIVEGDPESYMYCSSTGITVIQG